MLEELKAQIAACVCDEPPRPVETLDDYGLGGVNCELCGNTGVILISDEHGLRSRECECMKRRRSLRSIRNSNMEDLLSRYTFENYETPDDKRKGILRTAEKYVEENGDGWFFISGRSGSGKSHICTAICKALIDRNNEVKYMPWRDESAALKSCITDYELYDSRISKLKETPVLYIDDFWKGGVTEADVRLSFEIINARYCDSSKKTILSSELPIAEIIRIDEAVGGRIYERSRGYCKKAPEENWRLRQ